MSVKRRTAFPFILSVILSTSLCLNTPGHSCECRNPEHSQHSVIACNAKLSHYLAPKSDLDEDLGIIGWGVSVTKDIEKQTGKPADAIQIADIFKARTIPAADGKTLDETYRAQGYTVDAIADQETVLISGKGHGIIFYNSLYEPSADILSAKRIVRKSSLGKNVSYIIYNDIYSGILDELRGVEFDNRNLAAYVPIEIVQKLFDAETAAGQNRAETVRDLFKEPLVFEKSSVVSIDLSGFTAMTDKLTEILAREKDATKQAEAKKFVIEITNELFADIANVIDKFDASIIKFGGDARLVLLTGDTSATRALEMAQEVQLILRYFGGILSEYFRNVEAVDIGKIGNIRASIGISSGTAYLVVPTDSYGLKDVMPLGDVFYRAIQAQDEAKKGITITEETRQQLVAEGRGGLFSVYPPDKLPADRYEPGDRKILADKKVHVIDQEKMSFLDYEVRDRINFTVEYMTAVFNYLKKEKFESAPYEQITADFYDWKNELGTMKADVAIGDLSALDRLREMKKRITEIRIAVDRHLLSFFPEKDPHAVGETLETLAKLSVKKDYGRYVADRIGELFYRFRTEANRRAFYSKETLEKVKRDLAAFLPRGFEEMIVKEEKKDFNVERINFQNARIMFVQVYGLNELYKKTLAEKGPTEAARIVNEFFRKANSYVTTENGIIYLKSDPGAQYLKMIYLGGLKYISGVNPDTEMIKLAENLHKTAKEFGLEMKVGINSGPIILGLTGTNRRELTTISPEINLAARLGAYGKKGETIVSSRVYYASKDEVEFKERTDFYKDGARGIKVKGVSAEIPVFEPLKILQVQKRGKFLRLKELAVAKEWIDEYLAAGPAPRLDALLIQTKELGLGSETLAYEVERYANSVGFKSFGGKGKDEYEIMKTLLEEFCKITTQDTPGERLSKIQYAVSKYAPDMTEYYPVLKILFPFIEFPESEIVNNLGDDEKLIILNKLIEKFFVHKLNDMEDGKKSPILLRVFDVHHIKGDSTFLAPLINALKDKNVLIELVCNGPLPESLASIELPEATAVQPLKVSDEVAVFFGENKKAVTSIKLADLLKEPNRTIFVDRMDKGQILEVFHATCEFANRTALLREIDKLTLEDIRNMVDTDTMIQELGFPPETVIGTIPMKDILTYVKKLLSDKIYLLSGKGNPLIARHQAKRFIDLCYQNNIPAEQRGRFILREVLSQNISADNIAAFFHTQYNTTYFNNPRYRHILFDALCLGTEFDQEVLMADSLLDKTETQKRINELIEAGILRRGDLGKMIFDQYIYDVFIKHADIDNLRRGRLRLARLMEKYYKNEDGSTNEEHITDWALLFFNAFNLNISWEKQKRSLGTQDADLSRAIDLLEQSAKRYESMIRSHDAIVTIKHAIALIEYKKNQGLINNAEIGRLLSLYEMLGNIYKILADDTNSIKYFNNAIALCTNANDKARILTEGVFPVYYFKGDNDSLNKAVDVLRQLDILYSTIASHSRDIDIMKFKSLNRYGLINFDRGNYSKAKNYFLAAYKLARQIDDKISIETIYTNYSLIFREEGMIKRANNYLMKALILSKEIDDIYGIISIQTNLACNYHLLGNPRKTILYAKEAVRVAKEANFISIMTTPLTYCGEAYRLYGKFSDALAYYSEAERLVDVFTARPDEKADLYKGMGICYKNDHLKSINYLKAALSETQGMEDAQLGTKIMLECYGYLLEEYMRHNEIAESLKIISEIESKRENMPRKILNNKDIKIRLNVIDRLKCEIDFKLYKENINGTKNVFETALECYNKATRLNHRLGIARSFALILKIYNQIPTDTLDRNEIDKMKRVLSATDKIIKSLSRSKIPVDKILLAEIYYEISRISTLPSPINPLSKQDRRDADYYWGKTQDLLKRLIKAKIEDERILLLQDKLLNKPVQIPISTTKEADAAA